MKLEQLSETVTKMAKQVQMLVDVHEISNLMGTYVAYNRALMNEETKALFALNDPGVTMELPGQGIFVGAREICSWLDHQVVSMWSSVKAANEHTLTSPIIEVAGDGKTAKGIWSMPGFETLDVGAMSGGESHAIAFWAWGKYAVDFLKVDGVWKIWHLQVFPTFFTPYDQDWVKTAGFAPPEEFTVGPARGSLPNRPKTPYDGKTMNANLPKPPRPYQTFDPEDTF